MFNLFRTKTFTDQWIKKEGLSLAIDVAERTLCGIPLGSSIREFEFLGPTENPKAVGKEKVLYYYSLGICLSIDDDHRLSDFRVIWCDYDNEGFTAYAGSVVCAGETLGTGQGILKDEILSALGEPYASHRDSDEEIVFYDTAELESEFEFDLKGQLKQLIVMKDPLLADDFQREAYGITKPWPPC